MTKLDGLPINNTVTELWGKSPLAVKRFKQYKRNGKTFIRDYRREVKGGMNIADMQNLLNKAFEAVL